MRLRGVEAVKPNVFLFLDRAEELATAVGRSGTSAVTVRMGLDSHNIGIEGKVAVITGAAGGIGSAAARRFVEEGAKVFLVDREEESLKRISAQFRPEDAAYFVGDVADEVAVRAFVGDATERFGRIDIALLNAGSKAKLAGLKSLRRCVRSHHGGKCTERLAWSGFVDA